MRETLRLPQKPSEPPDRLRFIERKSRTNQPSRYILQERTEDGNWRDVPLVRDR